MKSYFKEKYKVICLGFALTIQMVVVQVTPGNIFEGAINRIEGIVYDARLGLFLKNRKSSANILVVDIDDRSLEIEERWPWSRVRLAKLTQSISELGALVIAFDINFSEPQLNPVHSLLKDAVDDQVKNYLTSKQDLYDADKIFAKSLESTDTVLGYLFQQHTYSDSNLPSTSVISRKELLDKNHQAVSFPGYSANIPLLQEHSAGAGFYNSWLDDDGFIRKAALIIKHEEKFYPSLSLEAARLYFLADNIMLNEVEVGNFTSIEGVKIGKQLIRTDERGRVLIPFRGGERSYPYISATDVMSKNVDKSLFENSIVFIGTSAVGLADLRSTPVGLQYPGVEVHANVVDALLQPQIFRFEPDWAEGANTLIIISLGIFLSLLLPTLGAKTMALVGLCIATIVISLNFIAWNQLNLALPLFLSVFTVLSITALNIIYGYFVESQQKQLIKGMFNQYVPPAHIDSILEDPNSVNLDGERKEISVLFSDIRSFTTISENLTASELKTLLNKYFSPITECIFNYDGTIDKYVGDMVMAFWNAPLDVKNHAEKSVLCALEMIEITHKLEKEFEQENLPPVKIGIGINTGEMNVGDMGSTYRRAYTVLGDSVNLGSRLEGLTKFYGVEILVSEFTQTQCEKIKFRKIDKVKVKGKDKPVTIFEPLTEKEKQDASVIEELDLYHLALESYFEQKWQQALETLIKLNKDSPRKIYQVYIDRVNELKNQPTLVTWDGSYTHTSK